LSLDIFAVVEHHLSRIIRIESNQGIADTFFGEMIERRLLTIRGKVHQQEFLKSRKVKYLF